MPDVTQVLLVEDQPLTRIGIRTILLAESDLNVAAEAETAADGLRLFRELSPDVAMLGLRLGDSCTLDNLDEYFLLNSRARIVVLAEHAGDMEIKRALRAGVLGYVSKNVSPDDLLRAIRAAAAGRKFIPGEIAAILSENIGDEDLTAAESTILRMIVGGMSNKEIAFALDISENTVKSHVSNIFDKLKVSDRTTATTTAIKRGLVRVDL